jgi:DNA-directed RNA polymerase subunit alpha
MQRPWHTIIKPKCLEVEEETLTSSYGRFTAEPFERGFGITLGNSLRRIMIASLQGAAITAVRIDGILHEFSTVPGVREDVTEIVLNLKEARLKLHSDGPETVYIKAKGEGAVTAKDIIVNSNVEVLNPDLHIATLSADATLHMELTVNRGRGYSPAEKNRHPNQPIGTIPIDAIFSPIRKVNYNITHARVGQITDYDKLSLEVWTDGSISPEDAVAYAAKIIQTQLKLFINFEDVPDEIEGKGSEEKPTTWPPGLYCSIDELELSVRSSNCLRNANIRYLWELVQRSEPEMLKTKNFGRKSLNEIKEILSEKSLTLGMKLDGFVPPEEPVAAKKDDDNDEE